MIDSDQAQELTLLILKTRMTFRQTIQRMLKQHNLDMTFEMLQVMHCLWKDQGVSQQYLAEKTSKDKACLTNLINNLEKKGWVVRKEDEIDRRSRLVYFTPEGEEVARNIKIILKDMYERIGKKMNKRQAQSCLYNLGKLNDIFENI